MSASDSLHQTHHQTFAIRLRLLRHADQDFRAAQARLMDSLSPESLRQFEEAILAVEAIPLSGEMNDLLAAVQAMRAGLATEERF